MNEWLEDVAFLKDKPKNLWVLLVGCSGGDLSELRTREGTHCGAGAVMRPGKGLGLWARGGVKGRS